MPRPLKITMIVLASLFGLVVVLGVIGALVAPDDTTTAVARSTPQAADPAPATRAGTTTRAPARPITLSGRGQDVTRAVTLSEGRWRIAVEVSGNTDEFFDERMETNIIVTALDEADGQESLVNDITESGTWTGSLTVGGGIFDLAPGNVWFEVDAGPSARWEITVEPL